eukprot:1393711-Amorphochlora_amoeboformis.AAC.2
MEAARRSTQITLMAVSDSAYSRRPKSSPWILSFGTRDISTSDCIFSGLDPTLFLGRSRGYESGF